VKLLALVFFAAALAFPAAAAPSPDLSSLALGKADLAGMTVTQEGYVAPRPGSNDPLRHFNRVFTFAPGGVLHHGESDVALYSSRAAAGAAIDRLAQAAHGKDFATQVATALKVKRLTVLRVHSLKLGDQSLEVAYRYTVSGKANPTEESLAFVRVGAIVQRIWLVGQRVDEGTVRRLATLVETRTRRAKQ
jgi:hypothetical protein